VGRVPEKHRFAPGRGLEHVGRVFDGLLKVAGGGAQYEISDFAPSGSVDLDHPLLQDFVSGGLAVRPKQAWTDVARFAEHGVVAATFGPGLPSRAHHKNEYVEIAFLEGSYKHLSSFMTYT